MKKYLFLLLGFIALASPDIVRAQNHGVMGAGDTLTVSSAVDTIYLYIDNTTAQSSLSNNKKLSGADELYFNVRLDSLSGTISTTSTLSVEYTNSDSPTEIGVEWFAPASGSSVFTYTNTATPVTTASTSAVSWTPKGVLSKLSWSDVNFAAQFARVRLVVTSSSKSIRARGWWATR